MRRPDELPLDPEMRAALEAIDATLAGEPVDPRHAELAELSLLLADDRPAIDPAVGHMLDERVKSRFATGREGGTGAGESGPRWWWGWLPAGGAAAAVVAAAVVAIVVLSPGGSGSSSASSSSAASGGFASASGYAASSAASSASSAAPPYTAPSSARAAPQPPSNGRKIVPSAQLYLSTPPDHVDDVAQEVFDVVGQQNGSVLRSSVTQTGGADGSAFFQLSVPSSSLAQTMSMLSRLAFAQVTSRTDDTQDVNGQYRQTARRLADARALHTALLKQLAGATTTQQIDSIQAQIHDAERSISSGESALGSLNQRIAFSDVSVTIGARPRAAAVPTHHGGGLTLGRAAHDARRVVTVVAGVALIALAAIVPIAPLAGLAWWVVRLLAHRRRERALDLA